MQAGTFSKSSYSATRHCLEAGVFRKVVSFFSGWPSYHEALCAEVGVFGTVVRVRDTKQSYLGEGPERPVLEFSVRAWERLLADIKSW